MNAQGPEHRSGRRRRTRRKLITPARIKLAAWSVGGALALFAAVFYGPAAWDALMPTSVRVGRAERYMAEGNYGPAGIELKKAVLKSPTDRGVLLAAARLDWRMGFVKDAQMELDRAIKAGANPAEQVELRSQILLGVQSFKDAAALLASDRTLPPVRRFTLLAAAQMGSEDYTTAEHTIASALQAAPSDPNALLQRARLIATERNYAEAVKATDAVLAVDPHMAAAWLLRGQLLLLQSDSRQSIVALQKGLETAPRQLERPHLGELLGALTEAQIQSGDATAAAMTLKQVDTRFPNSPMSRFLRARLAMLNKDYESAVASLQVMLGAQEEFLPGRILLAQALLAKGNAVWARDELVHVVAQHPQNLAARKLLAQVDLQLHDPKAAREVLDAVPEQTTDAQVDWLKAMTYFQSGGGDTGLAYLEHSVASSPQNPQARLALARAYVASGKSDKATATLGELRPEDRNPESQALLVGATVAGKSAEAAKAALTDLLAKHPDDGLLLTAAGNYWASVGELDTADRTLQRAVTLDGKNVPALSALAAVHVRQSNLKGADELLTTVLSLDPKNQGAYIARAKIAQQRGDRAGSRSLLSQAVSHDPSAVEARLLLAEMSLGDGNLGVATSLMDQAVQVGGDRSKVLMAAGELLLRTGHPNEALERFTAAKTAGSQDAPLNIARAQVALRRLPEARATLEAIDSPAASAQRAQVVLVQLDLQEKKIDEARTRIRKLSQAGLPKYMADELTGNVDLVAGQYREASDAFASALSQQPTSGLVIKEFQARRAGSLASPGDVLRKWLEKSPTDAPVRFTLAQYYQETDARPQAIAEYERLAGQSSALQAMVLNNLAWLYIEGADARSVDLARRAYEMAPASGSIADTYGWALASNGNPAAAVPVLEKAVAAAPQDANVKYHLAAAYERHGDKARAAVLLRELLKTPDKFSTRPEAEELLRKVGSS
jgi:putative PEP-CTERM system TPR-repeat lipoprotein